MPVTAEDLRVIIRAETDKAVRDMKNAQSGIDKVGASASDMAKAFVKANISMSALQGAFRLINREVQANIQAFQAKEAAVAKLEATLKATGQAAGLSSNQLQRLADSLQRTTTYSNDAVMEMQSVLLTFKSVQGDVFERTTGLALDLSAAFGGSLQSSAMQLGKALEDPVAGLSALNRVGVTFTDEQKTLIRQLVETGRAAEAQGIILDTLAGQVGGVAEAMAQTSAGAAQQLQNEINDLRGILGKAFAEMFDPATVAMTKWIQENKGTIAGLVSNFPAVAQLSFSFAGQVLRNVFKWENFKDTWEVMGDNIVKIFQAMGMTVGKLWGNTMTILANAGEMMGENWWQKVLKGLLRAATPSGPIWRAMFGQDLVDLLGIFPEADKGIQLGQALTESLGIGATRGLSIFQSTLQEIGGLSNNIFRSLMANAIRIEGSDKTLLDEFLRQLNMIIQVTEQAEQQINNTILGASSGAGIPDWFERAYQATLEGRLEQALLSLAQVQQFITVAEGETLEQARAVELMYQRQVDQIQEQIERLKEKNGELINQKSLVEEITHQFLELGDSVKNSFERILAGGIEDLIQGLVDGAHSMDSIGESARKMAQQLTSEIGKLALGAGLRLIMSGNPAGFALLALGGYSLFSSSVLGRSAGDIDTGPLAKIINAEQELAKARIEIIKDQLREERDLRRNNIRALEEEFNREFMVLRDMLDRNLLTHEQFRERASALTGQRVTDVTAEEESIQRAEEQAAMAIRQAELTAARNEKIDQLDQALRSNQESLRSIKPWEVWRNAEKTQLMQAIELLEQRKATANAATTVDAVWAARYGADFVTSGPQMLMVGDNPGGRERVTVEPYNSPNKYGPRGGNGVVININGPVLDFADLRRKLEGTGTILRARGREVALA